MRLAVTLYAFLVAASLANAQGVYVWNGCYWVPTQCGGGGCCQNWGGGQICYPQQPQRPRQPQDSGEHEGPPPKYELRPPQPLTPTLPPQPTIDPNALKEQEKLIKEIREQQTTIEKSLVVIRDKPDCKCEPTDLSPLLAELKAMREENHALTLAINELKNKQPAPAPVASGAPVYYDLRPHRSN